MIKVTLVCSIRRIEWTNSIKLFFPTNYIVVILSLSWGLQWEEDKETGTVDKEDSEVVAILPRSSYSEQGAQAKLVHRLNKGTPI